MTWGVWFKGNGVMEAGWCNTFYDKHEQWSTKEEAESSRKVWGAPDRYEVREYPVEVKPTIGFYVQTGTEIGELCEEKNAAYGDSFSRSGEIMAILYPDGISLEQMTDALGVVRVIDKLFRIANRKDAFGESPWRDIAGYGVLGAARDAE